MKRYAILVFSASLALGSLAACGAKSSSSSGPITIQLTNVPAALNAGQSASLTATVTNDSSNAGVDWSCAPSGSCGSFNPAHTASGGSTVFTAPASSGTMTITAKATASSSVSATATIKVASGAEDSRLNGPYVFQVQGADSNGPYTAEGRIVADGKGGIASGEQDYADAAVRLGPDPVTGNYSIGEDGRGSITLNINDSSLPNNGVETFSIALVSATHALIIQFDGTASSSGTLDAQAANASNAGSIDGPYAFAVRGYDNDIQAPFALGGVGALSATSGSLTNGTVYGNDGGSLVSSSFTATLTGPDASGRGTIAMDFGLNFIYYAVKGGVLRLIQSDAPEYITSGVAIGRGSAGTNASFSDSTLKGDYAIYEFGSSTVGDLGLAGLFSADGSGNLTEGFADTNDGGSLSAGSIAGQNMYTIAADGSGEMLLPATVDTTQEVSDLVILATDPNINLLDPNSTSGGGGALVIDMDTGVVASGAIMPRSSANVEGNYATILEIFNSSEMLDFVGQSTLSGSVSLAGTVDINNTGTTTSGASMTGTFAADAANPGRWKGSLTISGTTYQSVMYQASGAALFVLNLDTIDDGSGFLEKD